MTRYSPAQRVHQVGLIAGPLLALLVYFLLPASYTDASGDAVEFTHAGRASLAVGVWMAVWWLSEAVHISVTALIPVAVLPAVGALPVGEAAARYAHPLIFLFMGGFLISLSMQRWGLHRRIALATVRAIGTQPRRVVGGFMLAAAGLSMWVSNTATALMMLPIAGSVLDRFASSGRSGEDGPAIRYGRTAGAIAAAVAGYPSTITGHRAAAAAITAPASPASSKPPTLLRTSNGSSASGWFTSNAHSIASTFRLSPASSTPVPRPIKAAGSCPLRAAAIAAAAAVLPMPISPSANTSSPASISCSTTAIPVSSAASTSARLIAGPHVMFAVPGATFCLNRSGCSSSSTRTPRSATTTRAPTCRARALIAAPPQRKLPTICAVTSAG